MILGDSIRRRSPVRRLLRCVGQWFDGEAGQPVPADQQDRVQWLRILPFLALHAACVGVIWTGWSMVALATAGGLYVVRMFAITGGYHRYFSHRTYRLSRASQFVMAVLGNSAAQRGALWWAAHHRHHHRCADEPDDVHSPVQRGFWWSHVLWLTTDRNFRTRKELVQDWMRYGELRFLNRFSMLVPLGLLALLLAAGALLERHAPQLGTSAAQMGVWGFAISTVVLFHATSTINSLDHMVGRRAYRTPDHSRNNWVLAILTLGEGWHNNHHHYASTVRQGFYWWQWDPTYYVLKALSWIGVVRGLKELPAKAREPGPLPAPTPRRET
jgi:stearoyl-CoA desaturase (delta-9 desaturase)